MGDVGVGRKSYTVHVLTRMSKDEAGYPFQDLSRSGEYTQYAGEVRRKLCAQSCKANDWVN